MGGILQACVVSLVIAAGLGGPSVPLAWGQASEDALRDEITSKLSAGQTDAAVEQARLAVKQYPRSSPLYQLLGAALFKQGGNEEARKAFGRAIELDHGVPQNYYDLALVNLSDKRYADAATALETFLRLEPENAQAHLLLGRAYHNLNRTGPAFLQFQRALGLAPTLPLLHYHLGYAYQSQGDSKAALAEFLKEIANNPQFYDAYYLAGDINLNQGDLERAEELFRKGISVKPEAYQAHYGLARVMLQSKRTEDAVSELKQALEVAPSKGEIHYALARAYQRMGKRDEAQREFQVCAALHAQSQKTSSGIAGQRP